MERVSWDFSTKNVPIPPKNKYLERLVDQTSKFIRNARWKAFFTLNTKSKSNSKDYFGFNSLAFPPIITEMKIFEDKMLELIQNIEFKDPKTINSFQNMLSEEIEKIICSSR